MKTNVFHKSTKNAVRAVLVSLVEDVDSTQDVDGSVDKALAGIENLVVGDLK